MPNFAYPVPALWDITKEVEEREVDVSIVGSLCVQREGGGKRRRHVRIRSVHNIAVEVEGGQKGAEGDVLFVVNEV